MASLIYGDPLGGFTGMRKTHITVRRVTSAGGFSTFIYKCMLNVDWDGAPNAYGLDRPGIPGQTGLDPWESRAHGGSLGNARLQADWGQPWVGVFNVTRAEAIRILRLYSLIPEHTGKGPDVLSDASKDILKRFWDNRTETVLGHSLEDLSGNGKFPIVQIPEMSTTMQQGYYVSTTGWTDDSKDAWDPHRYLDASAVPYSVVPALPDVSMGDYGLIIRNMTGASTPYVCGDSSGAANGSTKLGECSGAVFIAMGFENEGDFSFIVFPNSRSGNSLKDTRAAQLAVRTQLKKLSADDADDLANHCASDPMARFNVRTALTKWDAPALVIPKVDAISGS
jgi:hypothetical protein